MLKSLFLSLNLSNLVTSFNKLEVISFSSLTSFVSFLFSSSSFILTIFDFSLTSNFCIDLYEFNVLIAITFQLYFCTTSFLAFS